MNLLDRILDWVVGRIFQVPMYPFLVMMGIRSIEPLVPDSYKDYRLPVEFMLFLDGRRWRI